MLTMKYFIVVLAIIAMAAAAPKPTLYAIVTEFTGANTATATHLVKLNPQTGSITDIAETFLFTVTNSPIDGIATFDFTNGVYYYAMDDSSDFIFRANVRTGQLMSPIAVSFDYIYSLSYDVVNQRILVAGAVKKDGDYVISLPTAEANQWGVFGEKMDSDFSFATAAFDAKSQTYYFLSLETVNNTFSNTYLHMMSQTSMSQPVQVKCVDQMYYPQRLHFDVKSGNLLAFSFVLVGNTGASKYYVQTIKPDGSCTAMLTQIPNGVVTDFAYDAILQKLYAALATNQGSFIYTIDATSGNTIGSAPIDNMLIPNNMMFAYEN